MRHLLAAISAHGYGHLAQTAPVLNALRARLPDLRLTLYTALPRPLLEARFDGDFTHIPQTTDVGIVTPDALTISAEDSLRAYRAFHRNWPRAVEEEAARLAALAPDLILANVPYRVLAAAARASIPAVALCSLNWADLFQDICGKNHETAIMHEQMLDAYNTARCFLQLQPGMPMPDIARRRAIGPIARTGTDRRADIRRKLGLSNEEKFVLISLGGIPTRLPLERWPRLPGVRWIVPADWRAAHPDAMIFESLEMNFIDVACSADALLTKPGYGNFTEAACNGIPLLYIPRDDWPETPYLVSWLERHGRCVPVARAELDRAAPARELAALWALPPRPVTHPGGITEAADYLVGMLA